MSVIATEMLAGATADRHDGGGPSPRLSTDFLNRYSEALMLIEMAAMDESVLADLQAWECVGYREHFVASTLRCAASALAAYDGLEAGRAEAFDTLCLSMSALIRTVTARLAETPPPELETYVEVAGETLRRQIARATRFINTNGADDVAPFEDIALQAQVDALFAG
ncbi:hypothetical protein [Bosea sp. (in: a-proteobacteria)]|uniref:hypothetical protein n=1 Tax=Bosea sp. (in: a-proteobacteria) TaxID=1871050 RepID=UPI002603669E|nr:hypothetical protein [Bosea sp. (in: a-proteobacteria)]MCO5092452.1 hypothetical protein [Bosea sp. (in: a-proteobacteria)]